MYRSLGFREIKEVRYTIWEKEFREMQMLVGSVTAVRIGGYK